MNVSAARFRNNESRRTASVTTCGSFSYVARSVISFRMIGTSFSVAAAIRTVMSIPIAVSVGRWTPHFDLDRFEWHGPDILDLMVLAAVEPRPSSLLAKVPRHCTRRECLSIGHLHDHRLRRMPVRLRRLSWREFDAIRTEPAICHLGRAAKSRVGWRRRSLVTWRRIRHDHEAKQPIAGVRDSVSHRL